MQMPHASIEILIGDDGAGVETPHIIDRLKVLYPGVITYFRHEKNLGPSGNYQFLARMACGQFIAHLDGDDFWMPGKLKAQIRWLSDNPISAACYTNAVVVSDDGKVRGEFSSEIGSSVDLEYLLVKGNFLNHSSMLYRSEYRGVVADITGPFIDYRMHLNFAKVSPLGFIDSAFVVYRLGSEHSMIRKTPGLVQELYFEAMVSVLSNGAVTASTRRRALRHFWRAIILETLVHGRISWATAWARKIGMCYSKDAWAVLSAGFPLACMDLAALVLSRTVSRFFQVGNLRVLHRR